MVLLFIGWFYCVQFPGYKFLLDVVFDVNSVEFPSGIPPSK